MYNVNDMLLRMICGVLLQMNLNTACLQDATMMMCWIKRLKATPQNQTMRYMSLTICFMKIISPLMSQICFSISVAQEPNPKMIIKGFMTLCLLVKTADLFE